MSAVAEHMAEVILGSLGLTYLIAFVLIVARPPYWRLAVWVSQIGGFGVTCFVMDRIGLQKPLTESLALALGGAGVGALAAWRWDSVADATRSLAGPPRRRAAPRGR